MDGAAGREHTPPSDPAEARATSAGPHEDSGGPYGYQEMVEALRDRRHPEHRRYREWAGKQYDPERFDPWLAGQNLMLAAGWGAV